MTILEDPAENMDVLLDRRRAATGPRARGHRRSRSSPTPARRWPRSTPSTGVPSPAHYVRQALAAGRRASRRWSSRASSSSPAPPSGWPAVAAAVFLLVVAFGRGYDRKTLGDGRSSSRRCSGPVSAPRRSSRSASVALAVPLPRLEVAATVVLLSVGAARRSSRPAPVAARAPQPRGRDVADARRRRRHLGPPPHPRPARCDLPRLPGRSACACRRSPTSPRRTASRRSGALADIPQVVVDHAVDVVIVVGQRASAATRCAACPGRSDRAGRRPRRGARTSSRSPARACTLRPTAGLSLLEVEIASRAAGWSPSPRSTARSAR